MKMVMLGKKGEVVREIIFIEFTSLRSSQNFFSRFVVSIYSSFKHIFNILHNLKSGKRIEREIFYVLILKSKYLKEHVKAFETYHFFLSTPFTKVNQNFSSFLSKFENYTKFKLPTWL